MKVFAFVIIMFSICLAQDQGFHDLEPQVIDRQTLAKQHYSKSAYSVITGILKGAEFPFKKWVVIDTSIVPDGATVRIPSDVKLYFEPEALLEVNGTLEINAQVSDSFSLSLIPPKDILYKSDNQILSWNGIKVGPHGRLLLRNVTIKDAWDGIRSEGKCDSLSVETVNFRNIRNSALTIKKYSVLLSPDSSFTLHCSLLPPQQDMVRNQKWLNVLSKTCYITSLLGIIGGSAATIFAYNTDQKVLSASIHPEAQPYSDKATRFYSYAKWSFIGSGAFLFSGISFQTINYLNQRE
jgi:hypothetical protein